MFRPDELLPMVGQIARAHLNLSRVNRSVERWIRAKVQQQREASSPPL
jgi:hypothetical protein